MLHEPYCLFIWQSTSYLLSYHKISTKVVNVVECDQVSQEECHLSFYVSQESEFLNIGLSFGKGVASLDFVCFLVYFMERWLHTIFHILSKFLQENKAREEQKPSWTQSCNWERSATIHSYFNILKKRCVNIWKFRVESSAGELSCLFSLFWYKGSWGGESQTGETEREKDKHSVVCTYEKGS